MSRRLWIPPLALALAIAPVRSQTTPQSNTTIKAETQEVLVDVVVTDGEGNPVPN